MKREVKRKLYGVSFILLGECAGVWVGYQWGQGTIRNIDMIVILIALIVGIVGLTFMYKGIVGLTYNIKREENEENKSEK